jgi:hypothetical protein
MVMHGQIPQSSGMVSVRGICCLRVTYTRVLQMKSWGHIGKFYILGHRLESFFYMCQPLPPFAHNTCAEGDGDLDDMDRRAERSGTSGRGHRDAAPGSTCDHARIGRVCKTLTYGQTQMPIYSQGAKTCTSCAVVTIQANVS